VELFAAIRRDKRVEDLSIRDLAGRHRVHRRTVRQALASATPPPRKVPVRSSRVLEPFKPAIDVMLRADVEAPRKQRHTARRVLARLVDEHAAEGLSYSTVRDYVAKTAAGDLGGREQHRRAGVRAAVPSAGRGGRGRFR
jgi:DNA-binding transcriptional regulator YhcF (GntR family)